MGRSSKILRLLPLLAACCMLEAGESVLKVPGTGKPVAYGGGFRMRRS